MGQEQSQLNGNGASHDSGEIHAGIRETRRQMDRTLDQLGERLQPKRLLHEVVDLVSSSDGEAGRGMEQVKRSASQVGQALMDEIRAHPLPALLVGTGIAWMLLEGEKPRGEYCDWEQPGSRSSGSALENVKESVRRAADTTREAVSRTASSMSSSVGSAASGVRDSVNRAASSAKETVATTLDSAKQSVSTVASSTTESASGAYESAQETGQRMYASASEYGSHAYEGATDYARRAKSETTMKFGEMVERHPLAVGLGFLALGIGAGLAIPRTRKEDELMGETSAELQEKGAEMARHAIAHGKEAALETADKVMGAAEAEGLTPQAITEKVGAVVNQVKEAAVQAVHHEGLDPSTLKEKAKNVAKGGSEAIEAERVKASEKVDETISEASSAHRN